MERYATWEVTMSLLGGWGVGLGGGENEEMWYTIQTNFKLFTE